MAKKLIIPPIVTPVTVEQAKEHERITLDDAENDALIENQLHTATRLAEEFTGRAFITQTWIFETTRIAPFIEFPRPPFQRLVPGSDITFTDWNNQTYVIEPDTYFINNVYEPARLIFKPGTNPFPSVIGWGWGWWPEGFLTAEFEAGYGDAGEDDPGEVPWPIKEGILQIFGHLYENRESQIIPYGAQQILEPFKVWYLR